MGILVLLGILLILVLIFESWSYWKYIAAAETLIKLGESMQKAFEAVSMDIITVGTALEDQGQQIGLNVAEIERITKNEAVFELQIDMLSRALLLDQAVFKRAGTIDWGDAESSKILGENE